MKALSMIHNSDFQLSCNKPASNLDIVFDMIFERGTAPGISFDKHGRQRMKLQVVVYSRLTIRVLKDERRMN